MILENVIDSITVAYYEAVVEDNIRAVIKHGIEWKVDYNSYLYDGAVVYTLLMRGFRISRDIETRRLDEWVERGVDYLHVLIMRDAIDVLAKVYLNDKP